MKIASNKVKDIIRFFKDELSSVYDESELETMIRYCFEEFTGMSYSALNSEPDKTVSESELLKFNFAVKDLKQEKPLQYILGKADFYGLKFIVNEHVLIPRPETEELVHLIISDLKKNSFQNAVSILDIGTGSGCIPISLKKNIPDAEVSAMDISEEALLVAEKNAQINNVDVRFFKEDILSSVFVLQPETYDIIVSNPPYITSSEKENMHKNVLAYEPHLALFVGDEDALLFYRRITDLALKALKPGGRIYFEINSSLGPETLNLIENMGFKNVTVIKDLSDKNRILRGTL